MLFYPSLDIFANSSSLRILIFLPDISINPSVAKDDSVRMALLVLMFESEARS